MVTRKIKIDKINKFIPTLDACIINITHPTETDEYYRVKFSLYESLGEMGEYYDFVPYSHYPTEEELIKDLKDYLKEQYDEYKEEICLTGREEEYLKILEKIQNGEVFKKPIWIK